MARRHTWLGPVATVPTLLLAGCLFHGKPDARLASGDAEGGAPAVVSSLPGEVLAESVPSPPAPPPPEPISNYRPRVVPPLSRQAATVEPGTMAARVEVTPAVRSKPTSAPPGASEPSEPPVKEAPLVKALRCALDRHPEEARQLLAKYEKTDRELLLALLRLTAGIGEGELEKLPAEEVAASLEQLSTLTRHLRQRAPLALENVCFCKKIEGFGRYEPVPATRKFHAGSDGRPGERLQIYAEVRNFHSRKSEGQYETILETTLQIRDAERREVAVMDLGRCVDRSQTPRQDYFLNFQLHVPPRLPPGLYTLWVVVKDVTPGATATASAREATCSLDFKVCAAGSPYAAGTP